MESSLLAIISSTSSHAPLVTRSTPSITGAVGFISDVTSSRWLTYPILDPFKPKRHPVHYISRISECCDLVIVLRTFSEVCSVLSLGFPPRSCYPSFTVDEPFLQDPDYRRHLSPLFPNHSDRDITFQSEPAPLVPGCRGHIGLSYLTQGD